MHTHTKKFFQNTDYTCDPKTCHYFLSNGLLMFMIKMTMRAI